MHNNQRSTNFLKQVRCAVLDTSHIINDKEISNYMRQSTYNFLRNNYSHYKFKIYEENNVDKILYEIRKDPYEEDISLVVVQSYGNLLYDTWKPLEHGYSLFREYCNNEWIDMADANKFFIMGHILDERESKDRWFRLHEQCFVINYKMWKQLGHPKFGGYETDPVEVREAIRSEENVHDGHTPTYLSPGTETITITKKGFGWNFINESLKSGLAVLNFDEIASQTKAIVAEQAAAHKHHTEKKAMPPMMPPLNLVRMTSTMPRISSMAAAASCGAESRFVSEFMKLAWLTPAGVTGAVAPAIVTNRPPRATTRRRPSFSSA